MFITFNCIRDPRTFGIQVLCLMTLFLVCSLPSKAQKEARNWVFGDFLHFEIDQGTFTQLTNSKLKSEEGCASVSDTAGNLLFYTNGIDVYDRLHNRLTSFNSLNSFSSCAQSSVFIKKNLFEYYLITNNGQSGLYYSLIDLSLNNGLGDFTVINQKLWCSVSEMMTTCYHANGRDTWLIVHEGDGDKFISVLFGEDGITKFVVSPVGPKINFNVIARQGIAKVSPNRKFLAVTDATVGSLDLYCFNSTLGYICDWKSILNTPATIYGVEFSANSSRLYVGFVDGANNPILQFNVLKWPDSIQTTKTIIALTNTNRGAMQLGLDHSIYLTGRNYIGRIQYPNNMGSTVNYNDTFYKLNQGINLGLGLPNFNSSLFNDQDSSVQFSCDCEYIQTDRLFIPNVITPDGDGWNDNLNFESTCFPFTYFSLSIFNRWGEMVFQTYDQFKAFNGRTDNGMELPAGVYYLILDYHILNGTAKKYTGTLTIIR